ncbi:hypothetical protein JCM24511_08166 [Saitozyma sp. JCM 24511]|nr:hypothetical protein JCM24511_08166 [Saitozyma sp. JCM 24511]
MKSQCKGMRRRRMMKRTTRATGSYTSNQFRGPPSKMIEVPVRVEPKFVSAAERTFPHPLSFCNYTSETAYSGGMYTYRIVKPPSKRRGIGCHDRCVPTVLCLALVASGMVNLLREL